MTNSADQDQLVSTDLDLFAKVGYTWAQLDHRYGAFGDNSRIVFYTSPLHKDISRVKRKTVASQMVVFPNT